MIKSILTLVLLTSSMLLFGQQNITGVVTEQSGEALIGVTINEKGTANGTITDYAGNFSIKTTTENAELVFSYVGYETKIVTANSNFLTVELADSATDLDEVVITALGIQREKKALGYAVQELDAEQIANVRSTNLVGGLSGKLAGVQINNGSSGVGSSSRIVIRGEASLTGRNEALFVVDGIPISNELILNNTENDATGFQEVDYGNGAAEISPDDIESISVLKGPAATALYGSRAASGVVVITTKTGKKSEGIGVSVNSSATFENPLRLPQYQNQYGQGLGEQFKYENGDNGAINDGSIYSYGPALNGQLITQFNGPSQDVNGNVVRGGDVVARAGNAIEATPFVANPDNVKNFYETGQTYMNNVALSGANDLGNFRLSFTNLDNQGMVPNTDLHRNSLSLSGGLNLTERLKVRTFLNYINSSSNNRPATGYGSENVQYLFTWMGRQADVAALQDYWQAGQEGLRQYNYNYLWMDNPYFAMFENTNSFNKDRFIGNVAVSYDFTEKLSLTVRSGMDNYNDLRESRRAFSTQRFRNGAYREDAVNYREINTDFLLRYKNNLGRNLDYSIGVGGNRLDQQYSYTSTTAGELSVPGIYNFENSRTPLDISQENFQKRINSLYGIGQVAYKSSLFLDVTLRNDWSSTLPADNNSYAYYSASLSTIFSEFMTLPSYVSFLKGRVSIASVGNDTDPYNLKNTFVFGQPYGANPTVTASNNLLNSQFRPERVNSYEVGADVRLWNNRIGLDVAAYRNISQDQIVELPVSTSSGYASRIVNGGKIRNQGIEAILSIQPFAKSQFNWNSYFNFSRNISRVESLPADIDQYVTGFSRVYGRSDRSVFYIAQEGGQMGDMYGTGLMQVDGRDVYDTNGNPVKDPNLRLLGNYNPDFILGWGNDFSYKNINFGFLFDLRYGGTIVSRTLAIASTSGVLENTLVGRENGVVGDGVVNIGTANEPQYVENTTAIPVQSYYIQFFDRDNEANALYDATYLKLREAYIGISLPQDLINRIGFADATFSIVGRNLLLFTENPHFDPELNALQGRSFSQGVEDMSYPSARSVGVSLRLKL